MGGFRGRGAKIREMRTERSLETAKISTGWHNCGGTWAAIRFGLFGPFPNLTKKLFGMRFVSDKEAGRAFGEYFHSFPQMSFPGRSTPVGESMHQVCSKSREITWKSKMIFFNSKIAVFHTRAQHFSPLQLSNFRLNPEPLCEHHSK